MNSNNLLFYTALLIVVLLALTVLQKSLQRNRRSDAAYKAKRVLSAPEAVLFLRLQQALPNHFVLSQVAMHRVLAATSGGKAAHNAISQKAIDFVICRKDFSVACVVELDDASHRKDRDAARDGLLSSAGIGTVRFEVKAMPSVGDIGMQLARFVSDSAPATAQSR